MRTLAILLLFTSAAWGIPREEIIFCDKPQGKLSMTVFYPEGWKATDGRPGIVFFFGGGFINGNKSQFFSKAGYLASRARVAASTEYRIKTKHNTNTEDALVDCQAAFFTQHLHKTPTFRGKS